MATGGSDPIATSRLVKAGITFDTGALIGLERRHQRIARVFRTAVESGVLVTVPAVVIAEWWRGASDIRDRIVRAIRIEATDAALARQAGLALATMPAATVVDALVMASAARRGDVVYTSDVDDLLALQAFFPSVRVLGV